MSARLTTLECIRPKPEPPTIVLQPPVVTLQALLHTCDICCHIFTLPTDSEQEFYVSHRSGPNHAIVMHCIPDYLRTQKVLNVHKCHVNVKNK